MKRKMKPVLIGLAALLFGTMAIAADKPASPAPVFLPTPSEVLEKAPASAWVDLPPEDVVVMTLKDQTKVVYILAPGFAPVHVDNIKRLIRQGWFDGAAVIRVQDNYVVQWGRADEAEEEASTTGRKPEAIVAQPPAEYDMPAISVAITPLKFTDTYAPKVGYVNNWPVASDGKAVWLPHCYGMIGVARGLNPSTGSGTQLYTPIGQPPRWLDRNLAVIGRIVFGMENLTNRNRGTETLGFYKTEAEHVPIISAKIMSDLPAAERTTYQIFDTKAPVFQSWLNSKANRKSTFFLRSAGAIDLCNALPPVRVKP